MVVVIEVMMNAVSYHDRHVWQDPIRRRRSRRRRRRRLHCLCYGGFDFAWRCIRVQQQWLPIWLATAGCRQGWPTGRPSLSPTKAVKLFGSFFISLNNSSAAGWHKERGVFFRGWAEIKSSVGEKLPLLEFKKKEVSRSLYIVHECCITGIGFSPCTALTYMQDSFFCSSPKEPLNE